MNRLIANYCYGKSRSLLSELESIITQSGPIFKNDNAVVYMKIEEAAREVSVESIIKSFSSLKEERRAFQALVINHYGKSKNR